jgi:2-octaprenyl-6-methoxyphenol hydroxylase
LRVPPGAADVLIVGGGHTGLLAALALHRVDLDVALIDPEPLERVLAAPFDGRALALMRGAREALDARALWAPLAGISTPVGGVRVVDEATGSAVDYDAGEAGAEPFAWGLENRLLRRRLLEEALGRGIPIEAPARVVGLAHAPDAATLTLADGSRRRARLVIGADGRESTLRRLVGIAVDRWRYRQAALTFAIAHEKPHGHRVREILRPAGPLALLPIGPAMCSLTWVEREDDARLLAAGGREALAAALRARIGDLLGPFEIRGEPALYPLAAHAARRLVAPRTALLGDAAHGMHPIHAQGFNLGVRDVLTLADRLAVVARGGGDPGESELLLDYERRRRADVRFTLNLTDGLNRLFSNDFGPAKAIRSLGFAALERVGPLKRLAMRRGMGLGLLDPAPARYD